MNSERTAAILCIAIALSLAALRMAEAQLHDDPDLLGSYASDDGNGRRLTNEYRLRQGQLLRGLVVEPRRNRNLQSVEVFLGIPYAAPPVGSLRFMPPGNALPWKGVKIATTFAPVCPQMLPDLKKEAAPSAGRYNYMKRLIPFLRNQSEDCLYLNIYAPSEGDYTIPNRITNKYPVLVFIHGESFEWNSGNPYDGTVLASYGKIIIVTINFRLGILGFMKPSISEHTIGNFGLLDQIAALQWVKDNIEIFNGDPDSVTLMGHGTGAACVNFLMVSPVANGLFHRAVLMSGSAMSDWALTSNPLQFTTQAAQSLNCPLTNEDLAECLRKKRLSEIMAVRVSAPKYMTPFGPIIDGSVIPNEPAQVMGVYKDLFSKYELMYGCTELESYHLLNAIALAHGMLESERDSALRLYIHTRFELRPELVFASTVKEYVPFQYDPMRSMADSNRDAVLDILSDARVAAPIIQTANYHSKANNKSYFYIFGHNSQSGEYAAITKSVQGEELAYIFGIPLEGVKNHFRTEYSQQEKLLSEAVMTYWTNFVKSGNPNLPHAKNKHSFLTLGPKEWKQYDVEWPEYDIYNQSYIHIGIPPYITSHYRGRYMRYWNEALPATLRNVTSNPMIIYRSPDEPTMKPKMIYEDIKWNKPLKPKHPINQNNWHKPSPTVNSFGRFYSYPENTHPSKEDPYDALKSLEKPIRPIPPGLMDGPLKKYGPIGNTPPTLLRAITADPSKEPDNESQSEIPIKTSGLTVNVIIAVGSLFLLINVIAFTILFIKKSRLKSRERNLKRSINNDGEVDANAVNKCMKNNSSQEKGCSMIKLLSISGKNISEDVYEPVKNHYTDNCKTPKSDDSGGFGRRFRLQRQMSNSTLDAHTKVREWIAHEIVRFSPRTNRRENYKTDNNVNILNSFDKQTDLKENSDIIEDLVNVDQVGSLNRSQQACTDSTVSIGTHKNNSCPRHNSSKCSSIQTQITKIGKEPIYAHLNKKGNDKNVSNISLDDKKGNKVSVAVDATPSARGSSVLRQQPIELSKSLDFCCCNDEIDGKYDSLRRTKTMEEFGSENNYSDNENHRENIYKSSINFQLSPIEKNINPEVIKIIHKHSTSDPVHDVHYTEMYPIGLAPKIQKSLHTFNGIQPPVAFRNNINVTTQEEMNKVPLTPEESLMTIKRRNFPKVLPDFPNKLRTGGQSQKRLSLPPQSFIKNAPDTNTTFSPNLRTETSTLPRSPPPLPPPRTTSTLDRKYTQIPLPIISDDLLLKKNNSPVINMIEIENSLRSLNNSSISIHENNPSTSNSSMETIKTPPSVIISANKPYPITIREPKIIIKASSSRENIINPMNCAYVDLSDSEECEIGKSHETLSRLCSNDSSEFDDTVDSKMIRNLIGLSADQDLRNIHILSDDRIPDTKGPPTEAELKVETCTGSKSKENVPSPHNAMQFPVMFRNEHLYDKNEKSKIEKKGDGKPLKLPKTPILFPKHKSVDKNSLKLKKNPSQKPNAVTTQMDTSNQKVVHNIKEQSSESSNDTEVSTGTVKEVK